MSIKQIGLLAFTVLAAISSSAYAFPTRAEMEANYQVCEKSDESWHRRWGAYLVSFDRNEADKICREQAFPGTTSTPRAMSCSFEGKILYAGYYCEEQNSG